MTKANVQEMLEMIDNLSRQIEVIQQGLLDAAELEDVVFDAVNMIKDGEMTAEEAWNEIELCYEDLEEGDNTFKAPKLIVDSQWFQYVKLVQPVPGGCLIAETSTSDFDTRQMGLEYQQGDACTPIDLALAEVKRGEIALNDGKNADNQDVDVYVYSDPTTEGFVSRFSLKYDELLELMADSRNETKETTFFASEDENLILQNVKCIGNPSEYEKSYNENGQNWHSGGAILESNVTFSDLSETARENLLNMEDIRNDDIVSLQRDDEWGLFIRLYHPGEILEYATISDIEDDPIAKKLWDIDIHSVPVKEIQ